MAVKLANLKKFIDAGGYIYCVVDLPVNSITTTLKAYELFQNRLAEIEKATSEAAQRGSGGTATNTATTADRSKDETHTDKNPPTKG